jgi:hypothetical protein
MVILNMGELAKAGTPAEELVEPGRYEFTVTSAVPKWFRSGNHGVTLTVTLDDGTVIPGTHLSLVLDNPASFFRQLEALGIPGSFFDAYEADDDDLPRAMKDLAQEVVGRRASAQITIQEFNGRRKNSIGWFKSVKS